MNIAQFFKTILNDLYQSVYVSLGGSLDDGTMDWANWGTMVAQTGIKILILLAIVGVVYWLLVYVLKRSEGSLRLSQRQMLIVRSVMRSFWLLASAVAVMSQIGIAPTTIKAVVKASAWSGFYYVLWANSGQMVAKVLRYYDINASIEQLLKNIVMVVILVLATATVLAQFGFDIVSLVAGLGIVGLVVGFAAQSTLANLIAGITILVEQFVQVGDWIRIGNKEGRVVKISLRATQILDRDNIIIIIPNATMSSSEVTNLTAKKMIRFDIKTKIALTANVALVREVILKKLNKDEVVLKQPAPMITVSEIGEFAVFLVVRFWVSPASVARIPIIKEQLSEKIKLALDEAGIEIPYPYMNVRWQTSTPTELTTQSKTVL